MPGLTPSRVDGSIYVGDYGGKRAASAGQAITSRVQSRRLQNPFPAVSARAIINAVYGFFQSFPTESWRVCPRPGPFAWDRASLSPHWFQRGQAPARCVTRHSGVESCSPGSHVDAGHHTALAPVVSIANIVQGVKTGTNAADSDLNPSVQISPSANHAALTPQLAVER